MRIQTKTDRGVAGLTILLSVVTMLFVIGLLVMIFSLMGGEMQDATYTATTVSVINETETFINSSGDTLAGGNTVNTRNSASYTLTAIWNGTASYDTVVALGNATVGATTGIITNASSQTWLNTSVSYTYIYDANNSATDVMFDTVTGISSTTDWFDIFVVIVAMVVLILLTVIIITAIRGSGLMSGGSA